MVPISHIQARRDLGMQPNIQLRKWENDAHLCKFPELEDRLHILILEKRKMGRKVGKNWISTKMLELDLRSYSLIMEGKKKIFSATCLHAS